MYRTTYLLKFNKCKTCHLDPTKCQIGRFVCKKILTSRTVYEFMTVVEFKQYTRIVSYYAKSVFYDFNHLPVLNIYVYHH